MEKVANKDIGITHGLQGYMLSYRTRDDRYYASYYIGHSVKAAMRHFRQHLYDEWAAEAAAVGKPCKYARPR